MQRQQLERLLQVGLTDGIINELGFVQANKSYINQKLSAIQPNHSTRMRDSIKVGLEMILGLNYVLMQLGTAQYWNFIHIVLTDGEDNSSSVSLEELCKLQLQIGATIPVSRLKTYFVGVDLRQSEKAIKEIVLLRACGLENSEFLNVDDNDIEKIFQKIQVDLAVMRQRELAVIGNEDIQIGMIHEQSVPVLQIKQQRYCVLFNLDSSGSMSGGRWNRVCRAVRTFVSELGEGDFIGALTFNDQVQRLNIKDPVQQIKAITYQTVVYQPPKQTYNYNQTQQIQNTKPGKVDKKKGCKCNIL